MENIWTNEDKNTTLKVSDISFMVEDGLNVYMNNGKILELSTLKEFKSLKELFVSQ